MMPLSGIRELEGEEEEETKRPDAMVRAKPLAECNRAGRPY